MVFWDLFGQILVGVVVGVDGWLFMDEEYVVMDGYYEWLDVWIVEIIVICVELFGQGIEVIIVLLLDKVCIMFEMVMCLCFVIVEE